jgi:DNA-binding transcriptional MerR regulator
MNLNMKRVIMGEQLSVSKTAEVLGCHPETVRRLERRGLIKAKRNFLNHRIFDSEEVRELKEKRERLH